MGLSPTQGLSVYYAREIRYQLLHGTAATVILAMEQRFKFAIFVVYEFRSSGCSGVNLLRNRHDLERFVRLLGGGPLVPGKLFGPLRLPGGGHVSSEVELFIGKAVRELE